MNLYSTFKIRKFLQWSVLCTLLVSQLHASVQFQTCTKIRKIIRHGSRYKYAELSYFTLSLCSERQKCTTIYNARAQPLFLHCLVVFWFFEKRKRLLEHLFLQSPSETFSLLKFSENSFRRSVPRCFRCQLLELASFISVTKSLGWAKGDEFLASYFIQLNRALAGPSCIPFQNWENNESFNNGISSWDVQHHC